MEDTTQLDQSTLNSLLGGTQTSLIPESLVTLMTVSFIVLNVLALLFFVFYVIALIRKWKVQSAVLHIQKDIAEIKAHLTTSPQAAPVQPAQQNTVIAQEPESSDADSRPTSNLS